MQNEIYTDSWMHTRPPDASGAKRLLLVDDEPNILNSLRRVLRKDGYEIKTADSGEAALAIMTTWPPDVIVTDQRMPGMSGVSFLRETLLDYPDAIRIVLSGYTELESVTSAINDGAVWKFLTKPWDDIRLCAVVAEAFRTKALADENLQLRGDVAKACEQLEVANSKLMEALQDQKKQKELATEQTKIHQEIFEIIPLPLLAVDMNGLIANANHAARFHVGIGTLIGLHLDEVLHLLSKNFAHEKIKMGNESMSLGYLIALKKREDPHE